MFNGFYKKVLLFEVYMLCLYHQDTQSVQYEVNPLCVLDFYIHESRQRTGCGNRMFEHMLKVLILSEVILFIMWLQL